MDTTDTVHIRDILAKSLSLESLSLREVSSLIALEDEGLWEEVFETARLVKEKVYGSRIVLFAPLYLSNVCVNDCWYCGFRKGNERARKNILSVDEAVQEAGLLEGKGYRRLLLVASEHPRRAGLEYLEKIIRAIYENTDIRILHANTAPMDVRGFKRLKSFGVGVYQCFQETYHIPTYKRVHPSGPKSDFPWRLNVMDRAIEAGFEDFGMGVLFGLYDWRWDTWALLAHALRLMKKFGVGPHTLSVPRIQPAEKTLFHDSKYRVSDGTFKKIVAIYRLALPYAGIVISTREPSQLRDELLFTGASQISAGSKTSPAGYIGESDTSQFEIGDTRSLEEVVERIAHLGLIPSLCTACYREKRSGERFRKLAEAEGMKKLCHENALLTLKEYAENHASSVVKEQLRIRLDDACRRSGNGILEKFRMIEQGKKDIHV